MFLYTRPTDRVRGTLTVDTGAEDPDYLAANLDGDSPDLPAKLTTNSGSWTRDVGYAARVDLCALIHHNFGQGLEVRLQGHTAPVWTAPRINRAFTIPAAYPDGFRVNVWLDLTDLTDRTLPFWRLYVPVANASPLALGEWAMYSTKRTFGIRNISRGSKRGWKRPALVHETDYLVRRSFPMQTVLRDVEVSMEATDQTRTDVDLWRRSALGQSRPFLIVPHQDEVDAWFVTFDNAEQSYQRTFQNVNAIQLTMRELSRGLQL